MKYITVKGFEEYPATVYYDRGRFFVDFHATATDRDGRHHAIKTNSHGDALRDSLQPFSRDRADNPPVIFATKRDKTYNRRKYLAVDTDAQTFTAEPPRMFYTRDEVIEVGSRDLAKLADTLTGNGFTER